MHGEFLELSPPQRIVLTWNVNDTPPTVDNHVTVEFHERDGGTEVVITHEGILTAAMRDGTNEGWTHLMASLATVVQER